MRICTVVLTLMDYGGLEEIAAALAVALKSQGHATAVLSTTCVPQGNQYRRLLMENKVPFVEWPLARLLSPLTCLLAACFVLTGRRSWPEALAEALGSVSRRVRTLGWSLVRSCWHRRLTCMLLAWWNRRWQPDLLHIHSYTDESSIAFVLDWAKGRGLPTLFEEHQTPDVRDEWWNTFRQEVNKATCVATISQASAKVLRDACAVSRPIFVVPPIVCDPLASADGQAVGPRRKAGALTIGSVTRLVPSKGLSWFLDVMATVRQVHPDLQLRVYGDGPLRPVLLSHAARLGLNGEQVFVGTRRREDLRHAMLQQTDIFVLPSLSREGLPLALVEAMACGLPIVATTVGGIPEVVEDGVNGLLCPPGDSACLERKLLSLVEDPEERIRLGRSARRSFEQGPFQPDTVCRRFVSIYEETLTTARSDRD